MFTSLVLSMTLAAPVPVAPPAPATSGPLPRLLEIKADANGKIMMAVRRTEMQKVQVAVAVAPGANPGGAAPAVVAREIPVNKSMQVELAEVKDLKITTADGKKVDVAAAAKQLKSGGVVIVSADGKPVNPNFLKLFKDDVLVLTSPELVGVSSTAGMPLNAHPPLRVQPVPLPAAPIGGVIQIQIAPGQLQILPAAAIPAPPAPPAPNK